jgi:hypothetical protein
MSAPFKLLVLPIALVVGCSGNSTPSHESGGESAVAGATSGGTTNTGGTSPGAGGMTGGSAGNPGAPGGSPSTSGSSAGGRSSASSGSAGLASGEGGGSVRGGGGGKLGASGSAGASGSGATAAGGVTSNGGVTSAGSGGNTAAGSGNAAGDGNTDACTRDLLKSTTSAYFTALAAHDPSTLPLADSVKFTENGKTQMLGQAGLWQTAGALKFSVSALDTETCNAATQAVVPDGNTDIPVAVRLKLVGGKLAEIETIAVRKGDYSVTSDTKALAASEMTVNWDAPVASDQANSRDEITSWMDKYYRQFPNGVCNTVSDCKRIENGGGSFGCATGASCSSGTGNSSMGMTPRLILADVETGLGVGYTMFQGQYTDTHMFKMYGGKVYGVSAILASATSSGWQ